jgi:hypothetical protein
LRAGRHGREQRDEPLRRGGMGEDGIAQRSIGQSRKHRDLDDCDDFAGLHPESGEAKNAITLCPCKDDLSIMRGERTHLNIGHDCGGRWPDLADWKYRTAGFM